MSLNKDDSRIGTLLSRAPICLIAVCGTAVAAANAPTRYSDLHDFGLMVPASSGNIVEDGQYPETGVVFDAAGNMYGTAPSGGRNAQGVVWERTRSGRYEDLHDFGGIVIGANGTCGPDGGAPVAPVSLDGAGNLYGTTYFGGLNGHGVIWEITRTGRYRDIHDFGGLALTAQGTPVLDGEEPQCAVTFDCSGNMYGTTMYGGINRRGMIWKLSPSGTYTDLHDFGGMIFNQDGILGYDGFNPQVGVTIDKQGDLFGTAYNGGSHFWGIAWELTRLGTYKDIHDFGGSIVDHNGDFGSDGLLPYTRVTVDTSGNLFGTASYGGAFGEYDGMVWEITRLGVYCDLHDFGSTVPNADGSYGPDGMQPECDVAIDEAGDLFGTTIFGGPQNVGVIWEITHLGDYQDLHDFGGMVTNASGARVADGSEPTGGLTFDTAGNLYGTVSGGGQAGEGLLWEISN